MELTKICRVCLLPQDEIDLLDWHKLVDSLEYRLTYKECFCKCTQINISLKEDPSDEDSQTQYLCFFCAQSLKDAYEFIKRARKADDELRSRHLDNSFEWVAVSAKDVEIEEDSNINDKEDITTANLNDESYENYLVENTKTENEELMDSPEIESDDDGSSKKSMKKFQKRKNDSKAGSKRSKKDEINMDEMAPCDVCQKVMSRRALVKHQHRHKPKTFLCQSCPKAFIDAHSLKCHEVIHDENRERIPCDQCGQSFLSHSIYKTHLKTHDINRKPMYQCTQCEKTFSYKHTLEAHQLHHQGPKLKCNICDKSYFRPIDLKFHLESHSGETPYRCNVCDKSYVNKRVLNKHMQQHEGYFRYTCTTCGEQFSKYGSYYVHRQQHTGPAYKCSICDKHFYNCFKCKRHIRNAHEITEDAELTRIAVKLLETREHRGRIVEVLKNPENQ